MIRSSLSEVQRYLRASPTIDWAGPCYQYCNRLAHLYLLRVLNDLPAWLVFVYFIGDKEMGGPTDREAWQGAIEMAHTLLGIRNHRLSPFVIDVFVPIGELA